MVGNINIDAAGAIKATSQLFEGKETTQMRIMTEAQAASDAAQVSTNNVEAASTNWFVAGWRPAIGWTCAVGLFYSFIIQPIASAFTVNDMPQLDGSLLSSLLTAMLGLSVSRTIEKYHGTARQ